MLSTIHKLFSGKQTTAEKSEEVEQQQYIQYAQEVECTLRLLEEHHEGDRPSRRGSDRRNIQVP